MPPKTIITSLLPLIGVCLFHCQKAEAHQSFAAKQSPVGQKSVESTNCAFSLTAIEISEVVRKKPNHQSSPWALPAVFTEAKPTTIFFKRSRQVIFKPLAQNYFYKTGLSPPSLEIL